MSARMNGMEDKKAALKPKKTQPRLEEAGNQRLGEKLEEIGEKVAKLHRHCKLQ